MPETPVPKGVPRRGSLGSFAKGGYAGESSDRGCPRSSSSKESTPNGSYEVVRSASRASTASTATSNAAAAQSPPGPGKPSLRGARPASGSPPRDEKKKDLDAVKGHVFTSSQKLHSRLTHNKDLRRLPLLSHAFRQVCESFARCVCNIV